MSESVSSEADTQEQSNDSPDKQNVSLRMLLNTEAGDYDV
jgi:hypothetical protein